MEQILVPVSWGELIDKITILEIKEHRISAPTQLMNVRRELDALVKVRNRHAPAATGWLVLADSIKAANEQLWELEDAIRECERIEDFGTRFIEVARAIYQTNDQRAALKRKLSQSIRSGFLEEKSYQSYTRNAEERR